MQSFRWLLRHESKYTIKNHNVNILKRVKFIKQPLYKCYCVTKFSYKIKVSIKNKLKKDLHDKSHHLKCITCKKKKNGYKKYKHTLSSINNQHLHTFMEISHIWVLLPNKMAIWKTFGRNVLLPRSDHYMGIGSSLPLDPEPDPDRASVFLTQVQPSCFMWTAAAYWYTPLTQLPVLDRTLTGL